MLEENPVLSRQQTGVGIRVLLALLVLAIIVLLGSIIYTLLTPNATPRSAVERDLIDNKAWVKRDPGNYDARIILGAAFAQIGDYSSAIEEFKEAAKITPKKSKAYFNLGFTYKEMGRTKEAVAQLKKASKLDPNWTLPYYQLARIYGKQGKYDKALVESDKVILLSPQASDVLYLQGTFYEAKKDKDSAIAKYKEALKYDPAANTAQAKALKRLSRSEEKRK